MNRGDRWLLLLPLILTGVGVIMVYSSSASLGLTLHHDPNYFLSRQLGRVALGLLALWGATRVDLRRLEDWSLRILIVAVALLIVVPVVGHVAKGAARSLRYGFLSLQPTDLGRLAAVVFLASLLRRRPPAEHGFWRGVVPPLLVVGLVAALIFKQPNLSSGALLGITGFAMLFLSGARLRHLAIPVGAGLAAVALMLKTHPYEMTRVETFVRFLFGGDLDTRGAGWQLDQSLIAIGSGGMHGRGLGAGLQKYLFLPEAHTDFICSILAEELGLLGATVLFVLFALFLWRGLRATARASDPFLQLVAGGLTVQLGLYVLVNLGVATGLFPTTGLPLPYVSYGGSALLANMAAAGLLYRISASNESREAVARQRWAREAA